MAPPPGAGMRGGYLFSLSSTYMSIATASCFTFDKQVTCLARSFALANAGKRMPARMAMMAITTNSSIRVKAVSRLLKLLMDVQIGCGLDGYDLYPKRGFRWRAA